MLKGNRWREDGLIHHVRSIALDSVLFVIQKEDTRKRMDGRIINCVGKNREERERDSDGREERTLEPFLAAPIVCSQNRIKQYRP